MCKDFERYLKEGLEADIAQELPDAASDFVAAYRKSNFQAWDECYRAFGEMRETRLRSDTKKEWLCVHLTAYLAAWGTYRGSSFLLKYGYAVHKAAVERIMDAEYDGLRGLRLADCTEKKNEKILKLYGEIRECYRAFGNASDTLATKIMLGTLACVPGYDTNVRAALSRMGLQQAFPKSPHKLQELFDRCGQPDFASIPALRPLADMGQPDMKILDFCLFLYGQKIKRGVEER